MRRLVRITFCMAILVALWAPAAAHAQTYVGGETPVLGGEAEVLSSGGSVADNVSATSDDDGGFGQVLAATGLALVTLLLVGGGMIGVGTILRRSGRAQEA